MASIVKDSDMSKEYKIWDNSNLYTKNDYNELTLNQSYSLNQGNTFKKKQKKNTKNMITNKIIEGFSLQNGPQLNTAQQSKNVLLQAQLTPTQQNNITTLKNNFNQALEEYQQLYSEISNSVNTYISRTGSNNPYLGKNIGFTTGNICYVTNKGVVKWYPNWDLYTSTAGFNGCPSSSEVIQIDLPWLPEYNTAGTTIPTNPPLISGTPMTTGQSCGNEGENVFVNTIINDPTTTYLGCYADNSSGNPTMTFIGGAPPPPNTAAIVNGNFLQPQIKTNTYIGYWGTNNVPGWYFNAMLVNSYTKSSYPIPYPGGNQCVSIYYNQYIYQILNLTAGTYTLSFMACGSSVGGAGNQLGIGIGSTLSPQTQANQNFYATPPVNVWTPYTETFNITTSGPFQITFWGFNDGLYSALANVSLSSTNNNASGTYTYSTCEQAAIDGGYQYFALQSVNPSTSQGYCAVSNDGIASTINGISYVASGQIALWSSNTAGNPGAYASFVNGSLKVINSSGAAIFSTPYDNTGPSNYIGCYGDEGGTARAMTNTISSSGQLLPATGPYSWSFGVQQCQQAAQQNNASYFGLQDVNSEGQAVCFISNDLEQTQQYGIATNCTQISDGSWTGGAGSNAVYSTSTPSNNFYLILQDDGNMCIYLGSGPNDNQGGIWCAMTNGQQQQGNPLMVATNNKFGQAWMPSGSLLYPGEYLSYTNGNLVLIMQSDGNLVLYTYQLTENCQKMADGNTGGNAGANSLYELSSVGIPGNMENIAYIDQDSNLYTYPDSNIQLGTSYTEISGYDSSGQDIPGTSFGDATVDTCQTACNNNQSCGGFVFDNVNNICYPKTTEMYPNSPREANSNTSIYTRNKVVQPLPPGISSLTQNIDTIQYQNYVSSGKQVGANMDSLKINSVQKAKLEQLQTKLQLLANKIVNLNGTLNLNDINVTSQSAIDSLQLGKYLTEYKITDKKIDSYSSSVNTNIQNILNDSDITVLQQNYKYMFWTTLAVGTVLLSMNVV
jgi:hypothetical protein